MVHYLVVTAIGTDRPGIVNQVVQHVSECGCNIVDGRLAILGNEFTFIMLLSGDWNAMTQIEHSLPRRSVELDLITMMKRTAPHKQAAFPLQAEAEIWMTDEPGIISQCTQFFSDQGWDIQSLRSETLTEQPTPILKANFQLGLPDHAAGQEAEHVFSAFCQSLEASNSRFSVMRKY